MSYILSLFLFLKRNTETFFSDTASCLADRESMVLDLRPESSASWVVAMEEDVMVVVAGEVTQGTAVAPGLAATPEEGEKGAQLTGGREAQLRGGRGAVRGG